MKGCVRAKVPVHVVSNHPPLYLYISTQSSSPSKLLGSFLAHLVNVSGSPLSQRENAPAESRRSPIQTA